MKFITDKQTLEDLNLLGKYKTNSIFNLFNHTHTRGGEKLLEDIFRAPLQDHEMINRRSSIFAYFEKQQLVFPVDREQFGVAENYLNTAGESNLFSAYFNGSRKKLMASIIRDEKFKQIQTGLYATIHVLNLLKGFTGQINARGTGNPFQERIDKLGRIFRSAKLQWLSDERETVYIPFLKMIYYDYILRTALRNEMKELCEIVYHLDVYISVGELARSGNFSYAKAHSQETNIYRATGLFHPTLRNAVSNDISFTREGNILFLTGANMAGKSTFMKTFGISVYLAHCGLPVAATELEFSVKQGIFSSINVPDDLSQGLSHFYAEVMRLKSVSLEVSAEKNLVVIFDELFKGTNVKDAYDATLEVTKAFAEYDNCLFIISTHIIEVGEVLRNEYDNIRFRYFPTIMEGSIPRYPHKLAEGISTDRHGMMIIENEGILDIIAS